jgi:hypothetical protein
VWFILLYTGLSVLYTWKYSSWTNQNFRRNSYLPTLPSVQDDHRTESFTGAVCPTAAAASATVAAPSVSQFVCARYCCRCTVPILRIRSLPLGYHILPTLKHVCYCDKRISHSYHNVCHFNFYRSMMPEFVKYKRNKYLTTELKDKYSFSISQFHRAFQFTMFKSPTNAFVCNKTLIHMSHIKTLKITPTCFDHQLIITRELMNPTS